MAVLAAALLIAPQLHAQSRGHFTFGVQGTTVWAPMSSLNFNNFPTAIESCRCAYFGWGLRLTARVIGPLGLDAEWDDMPHQGQFQQGFQQVFVGPRLRALSLGPLHLFFYVRPGLVFAQSQPVFSSPVSGFNFGSLSPTTHFALDGGGSLEVDTSRHWLFRLDLGDVWESNVPSLTNLLGSFSSNNPQASLGFAYRF